MVAELKILIHSHDNDRIIQREKTTCSLDKFPDTFLEFKQHVNKFVVISDVAKELNFPHYDTTFVKVVKKPQSTSENLQRYNDERRNTSTSGVFICSGRVSDIYHSYSQQHSNRNIIDEISHNLAAMRNCHITKQQKSTIKLHIQMSQ